MWSPTCQLHKFITISLACLHVCSDVGPGLGLKAKFCGLGLEIKSLALMSEGFGILYCAMWTLELLLYRMVHMTRIHGLSNIFSSIIVYFLNKVLLNMNFKWSSIYSGSHSS